jgi:hypothetical protein
MPRSARYKSSESTFYHLLNRVAGEVTDYPFQRPYVARRFLAVFEFYLRLYFCRLASFSLLGNHYHAVVYVPQFRQLDRPQLHERARLRFGRLWRLKTRSWKDSDWSRFNQSLFDVSCFMQHVNGEFSKWYNRRHRRRGPFWAERFKNPELLDREALQRTILYCELNAVRAGLVPRPEDYKLSSAHWRWRGKKSDLLIPLEELFDPLAQQTVFCTYRSLLYHYGAVAPREGQRVIAASILQQEQQRGFAPPGLFLQPFRFFTDGLALGSHALVFRRLQQYRQKGWYRRRRHPIAQLDGRLFSLREQRSHAFCPG